MHFLGNKVWGNAGALFLMTFPLCVSGSHLGNSHNVSNLFLIITIVMVILSLVTFDVTIVIALGCHLTCPCKITKLTDKCHVCSIAPLIAVLHLSFCELLVPWDTMILKLGQLITLPWPLSVQMEGTVAFISLNQNLETIKLSEKGMAKVEISQKLGFLNQFAKLWLSNRSSWRKLKLLLQWTQYTESERGEWKTWLKAQH